MIIDVYRFIQDEKSFQIGSFVTVDKTIDRKETIKILDNEIKGIKKLKDEHYMTRFVALLIAQILVSYAEEKECWCIEPAYNFLNAIGKFEQFEEMYKEYIVKRE